MSRPSKRRARGWRLLALLVVVVSGCGGAGDRGTWLRGRMTCRVEADRHPADLDPHQLHRYAISPLLETAVTTTDVAAEWSAGAGLTVRTTGAAPALEVPAPVVLQPKREHVVEVVATTQGAVDLELAWTDETCTTPGQPCRRRQTLPGPGTHVVVFDLGDDLHGAARRLVLRLPAGTPPVLVRSVRAGPTPALPPPPALARTLLDGAVPPKLLDGTDAHAHHVPGEGLRLATGSVVLAFGEHAEGHRHLVVEATNAGHTPMKLYFIAPACPQFSEACAVLLDELEPGVFAADLSRHPAWTGTIRALRVDARAAAVLRAMRFETTDADRARRVRQTLEVRLVGGEGAADITAAHQITTRSRPPRGVKLRFPRATVGEPLARSLTLSVDRAAEDLPVLVVEGDRLPGDKMQLYFTTARCPMFSEECRATLQRSGPRSFVADLARVDGWTGMIGALRLDFDRDAQGRALVTKVYFPPSLAEAHVSEPTRPRDRRGAFGLSRLFGGRLGWQVSAGSRLDCAFPDDATGEAPQAIEVRVPEVTGAIQFGTVVVEWQHADGSVTPAARWDDSFGAPRASGWQSLPLRAPDRVPTGLRTTVTCDRHCEAVVQASRVVEVAQPVFRRVVATGSAPAHLLLVSIDTLRADHLSLHGYDRTTDPFLTRWAAHATVYEQLYAVDTWTLPTHAALMTGALPLSHEPADFVDLPLGESTLAETLAERGFATVAAADGILLDPSTGLDQGFDHFESRFEPLVSKREAFVRAVVDAEATGAPVFAFLHTYAVHSPYSAPLGPVLDETLRTTASGTTPTSSLWTAEVEASPAFRDAGPTAIRHLQALYDSGIRDVDRELEALLTDPRLASFLSHAVVAITSDHGEEFMEHGHLGHGRQLPYRELLHVPLLIHAPGQTDGRREPRVTSQTAVRRMLLDAMGVAAPSPGSLCERDGVAPALVVGPGTEQWPHPRFRTAAAVSADWEVLRVTERATGMVAKEEVVPRSADGGDTPPAETLAALREVVACVDDALARRRAATTGGDRGLTPADRAKLRALGYVGD